MKGNHMINLKGPDVLACPLCEDTYVHLDQVLVNGRPRESAPPVQIAVDHKGVVTDAEILAEQFAQGERHTFTLTGWCETCGGRVAVVFRQHKGQTQLEVLKGTWELLEVPPDEQLATVNADTASAPAR